MCVAELKACADFRAFAHSPCAAARRLIPYGTRCLSVACRTASPSWASLTSWAWPTSKMQLPLATALTLRWYGCFEKRDCVLGLYSERKIACRRLRLLETHLCRIVLVRLTQCSQFCERRLTASRNSPGKRPWPSWRRASKCCTTVMLALLTR